MPGGEGTGTDRIDAPVPRWRHPAALLVGTLGAMLAMQVAWMVLNQRPLEWDAAWYMEAAVRLKRALVERGLGAYFAESRNALKVKSPGVSMAAALSMAVLGESPGRAIAVNLAAWLAAAFYLYLLARRFLSSEASALAALLASAMPIAFLWPVRCSSRARSRRRRSPSCTTPPPRSS